MQNPDTPQRVRSPAELGELARRYRKQRRLRQDQVASLSNVSTGFLVDFEKGKETAEIGKIFHVLSTLGLEVVVSPRAALLRVERGRA
jgi:transcriptional regulator with XRE-family HTH domain